MTIFIIVVVIRNMIDFVVVIGMVVMVGVGVDIEHVCFIVWV